MWGENANCQEGMCPKRRPKPCKWFQGETGCMREQSCDFSHEISFYGKSFMSKVKVIH